MHEQLNNNFQFMAFDATYDEAQVILFGAPFDGTTSFRPGTRFASVAMRPEFSGLETYSPKLQLDLEDYLLHDGGEIEFPQGDTVTTLATIKDVAKQIINDEKKPLMIGGEHLVTLPVVEAVYEKYPEVHIFHFDAHTDLREELDGQRLSHATVMRRIYDFLGDGKIHQFGIRSGMKTEFDFALLKGHTYMEPFSVETVAQQLETVRGKHVYVTIDLDILDPSVFPGTGTPEAGGITFKELETVFLALKAADINLVGADLVELSPHYDQTGVSTAVANKVLRELALLLAVK